MKDEIEVIEVQPVSVTEAQTRADIDIAISTAKKYPRNTQRAIDNVIALVSKDVEIAKTCVYSLPRAGKEIDGPSVHLARIVASEYGNLRVEAKIVEIGDKMLTTQATAFDLQSNYAVRTEVKRRITDRNGQKFTDDMIIVTANAALAIASRNAIFQVVPATVTTKVYSAAQKAIVGNLSTEQKLIKRRKELLDGYLDTWNVTEAEILSCLGIETVNQIKEPQIVKLIGLANAINDGDTTIAEAFGRNVSTQPSETKKKVDEAIKLAQERRKPNQKPENEGLPDVIKEQLKKESEQQKLI